MRECKSITKQCNTYQNRLSLHLQKEDMKSVCTRPKVSSCCQVSDLRLQIEAILSAEAA